VTELDLELPELAAELIAEYGADVQYVVSTQPAYNPATGKATAVENNFDFKAIVEDYSLQGSGQAFASGLVESGDKKLTTAASFFDEKPSPGDKFRFEESLYTVLNVKTTYSGQLACLYEIQGRA